MEGYLAAAEAIAPGDPDLRAGAWAIGRGLSALLAEDRAGAWAIGRGLSALLVEDRAGARHAFTRARQEAPDQHARILNPYEGPGLLLRALAGEADPTEVRAAASGVVSAARWPELWFGAALAVACGAEATRPARPQLWPARCRPAAATRFSAPWCSGSSPRPPSATGGERPRRCCGRPILGIPRLEP